MLLQNFKTWFINTFQEKTDILQLVVCIPIDIILLGFFFYSVSYNIICYGIGASYDTESEIKTIDKDLRSSGTRVMVLV